MSRKSLPPTRKKLERARKQGDVARSRLLGPIAGLLAGLCCLFLAGSPFLALGDLSEKIFFAAADFQTNTMLVYLRDSAGLLLFLVLPFALIVTVVTGSVEVGQVGIIVSAESLTFNLNRLNPLSGWNRIWGLEEGGIPGRPALEALRLLLIAGVILGLGAITLQSALLGCVDASALLPLSLLFGARLSRLATGLLTVGALELLWAQHRRRKRLAMDFEEYSRELRESEGSAETRAFRRQVHQEVLTKAVLDGVRRAKVLIVGRE